MTRIASIDPGNSGAIVCWDTDWRACDMHRMPLLEQRVGRARRSLLDVRGLAELLKAMRPDHVVLERQTPFKGQGLTSTASIMRAYGAIEGIVAATALPYDVVDAKIWRKAARLTAGKQHSLIALKQRAPQVAVQAARLPKAVQVAVADAWFMIAWYCATQRLAIEDDPLAA